MRSHRLAARTLASHAGNRGSIPRGSAISYPQISSLTVNITNHILSQDIQRVVLCCSWIIIGYTQTFRTGNMNQQQPNNPLHGITLEMVVNTIVDHFGWEELGKRVNIKCFKNDPSVKSSLKFLRRTPWARRKVEELYLFIQSSIGQGSV